jgi:glycosyltransferase involved in cell wall biosynthesis
MKKLTVLHTIETAGPGGAETVVLELASRLDPNRFRSVALIPREDWLSKNLRERGVTTHLVDSKAWHDFRLPRGMASVVRDEKVDLIHSHLPGQNFYSCLVGKWAGCKTVATYHGALELAQSQGPRGAIMLGTVRRTADAVVVVCDFMGKMLEDIKFPSRKILRIYNGIQVENYEVPSDGRLRNELGLRNGTKIVGTVANLRQTKGYAYFVEAAGKVLAAAPDTRFVAVGDIKDDIAQPLYLALKQMGIEDRFHFLGFRKDVPELLSELDVFVLASVSEGFPLVALQAMAASRAMVVTRSGGPQEIVDDGSTGFLVPPADSGALAEKITALLRDPGRANEFARAARAKVGSVFSIEKMISEYESLYERLLSGGGVQ